MAGPAGWSHHRRSVTKSRIGSGKIDHIEKSAGDRSIGFFSDFASKVTQMHGKDHELQYTQHSGTNLSYVPPEAGPCQKTRQARQATELFHPDPAPAEKPNVPVAESPPAPQGASAGIAIIFSEGNRIRSWQYYFPWSN
jgi:hypothetical protein